MKRKFIASILISSIVSGCMGSKSIGNPALLEFITDGQTTRTETILQLGQPSANFESEKILTYRLGGNTQNGYFIAEPQKSWSNTNYSLVFVFNQDGILQSHSLVRIR